MLRNADSGEKTMSASAIRLSFFLLLATALGPAATLRSLVNEGNARYETKEYEEALKNYRLAAEQSPDSPLAHFNLGAGLYRTGEYTQAVSAFQHAAQMAREAGDVEAETLSRYNLGNSFFRASDADAKTNPREAIGALENAVESYRQALELTPGLQDARHNTALARKRMKELLEMMQNAPAGGQSQDQKEQIQKDIEESLERQKELTQQREDLERRRQEQQGDEQLQQQAEDLAQQQKDLEQQSREMANQLDKPQATPQEQQAKEQLEQAAQQQQQASDQLGKQQLQQAEGAQQQARQRLEAALASLGGQPSPDAEQESPRRPGDAPPQPSQQRMQALEQSPQDILNEERNNRRRRRMLMLGAQSKVDKDW
jgi:DNA repair exonuclease SbcCD ATPase subunit